jgi:hypothetical protein
MPTWSAQAIDAVRTIHSKFDFATLIDVVKRGARTYADYRSGGLGRVFSNLIIGKSNNANSYRAITGY